MKAIADAFNKENDQVGTVSVIVKLSRRFVSSSSHYLRHGITWIFPWLNWRSSRPSELSFSRPMRTGTSSSSWKHLTLSSLMESFHRAPVTAAISSWGQTRVFIFTVITRCVLLLYYCICCICWAIDWVNIRYTLNIQY